MKMGSNIPKGGEKPAKISVPSGGKGAGVEPRSPVGKAPGSSIPGFSGSGLKPSKV